METLLNFFWLANSLFLLRILPVSGHGPRVDTQLGELVGCIVHVNDTDPDRQIAVKQFLGVPFAKPPIGDLRFQKPEPIEAWPEPIYCKDMPDACVQYIVAPFPWAMSPNETHISEDCLFMNIWVPEDASPKNKKSVFFWVHGGGFFMGSIRQPIYDGRVIAALGGVIVVTTNYRLGSLGFWTNNGTTAPGNVGIWDVITALKWVNEHIESFGGDKNSITIAGESAGSAIVNLLTITPYAQGLYERVIMQSGSSMWTIMDNANVVHERSYAVAKSVGCASEQYTIQDHPDAITSCMKDADALDIIKAEASLDPGASSSFLPRHGDELFPRNPREVLSEGNFNLTELFIGNSGTEGAFKVTVANPDIFGFFGEKDPVIDREQAAAILSKAFAAFPDKDGLIKYYLPEISTSSSAPNMPDFRIFLANALGGFGILCPTVYFANAANFKGANVYYYHFQHRPSKSVWSEWMGTTHFDEVDFVFGGPFKSPEYPLEERRLSKMMIKHWSNFVIYGKPKEDWPPYSYTGDTLIYTESGEQFKSSAPFTDICDYWRPYMDPAE